MSGKIFFLLTKLLHSCVILTVHIFRIPVRLFKPDEGIRVDVVTACTALSVALTLQAFLRFQLVKAAANRRQRNAQIVGQLFLIVKAINAVLINPLMPGVYPG